MLLRIFTTWVFAFIPSKSPRGTSYHINYQRFSPALIVSEGWPWDGGDSPRHCFYYLLTMKPRGCVLGAGVSASNNQILNSDERPWEGVQGRKALRRGKPMFICNHICDVWQHNSGGGRREKKIPTAALEHFFSSPFDHLNIFAVKDATGEQEKTVVLIKVHFFVCVCVLCANSSSWHSLFKDGRGTGWMLNCYVRQIVASDNQQPSAPSLTCHLRPNIIPFSSDRISLLQVANYFFPSLVLKRCSDFKDHNRIALGIRDSSVSTFAAPSAPNISNLPCVWSAHSGILLLILANVLFSTCFCFKQRLQQSFVIVHNMIPNLLVLLVFFEGGNA